VAPGARRDPLKVQTGVLGKGVLGQKAKVELDRIVHKAGQLADDQVDSQNPLRARLFGVAQRDVQYALSNRQFVHNDDYTTKAQMAGNLNEGIVHPFSVERFESCERAQ
jgi:hypothetical protein